MDDYLITSLIDSKNEWVSRLINILTPCLKEGINSINKHSWRLCKENNEKDKYLMTFQNLLSRIPKWNQNIISDEKKRICEKTGCNYIEDLITCVHIIQLKALTCVKVGNQQKKIDIDIPSLDIFIHKIYINIARKLYSNIYLFEKNISPLQFQKNNRILEIIIKEAIIISIQDNIPIENILRNYIDETYEEDVENMEDDIENTSYMDNIKDNVKDNVKDNQDINNIDYGNKEQHIIVNKQEDTKTFDIKPIDDTILDTKTFDIKPIDDTILDTKSFDIKPIDDTILDTKSFDIKPIDDTILDTKTFDIKPIDDTILDTKTFDIKPIDDTILDTKTFDIKPIDIINDNYKKKSLSFNDIDFAINEQGLKEEIVAPKNIERLEELSKINYEKRKNEEDEEDDDNIKIGGNIETSFDELEVLDLEPLLDDIEIL